MRMPILQLMPIPPAHATKQTSLTSTMGHMCIGSSGRVCQRWAQGHRSVESLREAGCRSYAKAVERLDGAGRTKRVPVSSARSAGGRPKSTTGRSNS